MTSDPGEYLSLRRIFDAEPEVVFAAWTDPALLAKWWGPPGSEVKDVEVDLQVAGKYLISFQHAEGMLMHVSGEYRHIEPTNKLAFTWQWDNPEMNIGESLVTIEFMPIDGKTELLLKHELLPNAEARIAHEEGWVGILDELRGYLVESARTRGK